MGARPWRLHAYHPRPDADPADSSGALEFGRGWAERQFLGRRSGSSRSSGSGTTSTTCCIRLELTVAGALTVTGDHLGQLLNYTGAGHTWTLNAAPDSGYITVFNNGTGPITIAAGTATVTGETTISVGSVGGILYSAAGTKAYVGNSSGPTYQEVSEPNVSQTNYQIARTSSDILVELTTDLTAPRTFLLPTTPAEGDLVRVYRNAGGFFDWTNSTTGTALGYRNDYAAFQRACSAWKRIETRGRAGAPTGECRQGALARRQRRDDRGHGGCDLHPAADRRPVDRVAGYARAAGRRLRYARCTPWRAHPGRQQHPADHLRRRRADHRSVRQLEVKVSHRPVETAALPTSRDFAVHQLYRRPAADQHGDRRGHLPAGQHGPGRRQRSVDQGPRDIEVPLAPNVEYGQEGANFSNGSSCLRNFECQGMMGWEVMAFDTVTHLRKYLITGQTSLSLADPINLETGDVDGVLPEGKGGTGLTRHLTALHQALEALGFEPLYPDLPTISASMLVTTAHIAGVNPVDTTAADVTLTIRPGLGHCHDADRHTAPLSASRGAERADHPGPAARRRPSGSHSNSRLDRHRLRGSIFRDLPAQAGPQQLPALWRPTGQQPDQHRWRQHPQRCAQGDHTPPYRFAAPSSSGFSALVRLLRHHFGRQLKLDFHHRWHWRRGLRPDHRVRHDLIWKTTAGILLAGKGATSPQLVSI